MTNLTPPHNPDSPRNGDDEPLLTTHEELWNACMNGPDSYETEEDARAYTLADVTKIQLPDMEKQVWLCGVHPLLIGDNLLDSKLEDVAVEEGLVSINRTSDIWPFHDSTGEYVPSDEPYIDVEKIRIPEGTIIKAWTDTEKLR